MSDHLDLVDITDLRALASVAVKEGPVPADAGDSARFTLDRMIQEASAYGFSEADVVRAVMRPVLEWKAQGCNCHSCRARRGEFDQGDAEGGNRVPVAIE